MCEARAAEKQRWLTKTRKHGLNTKLVVMPHGGTAHRQHNDIASAKLCCRLVPLAARPPVSLFLCVICVVCVSFCFCGFAGLLRHIVAAGGPGGCISLFRVSVAGGPPSVCMEGPHALCLGNKVCRRVIARPATFRHCGAVFRREAVLSGWEALCAGWQALRKQLGLGTEHRDWHGLKLEARQRFSHKAC